MKILKKFVILFSPFVCFFVLTNPVLAAATTITQTSYADFSAGTGDAGIDLTTNPGSISLTPTYDSYTDDTLAEFEHGSVDMSYGPATVDSQGIKAGTGYFYLDSTDPIVASTLNNSIEVDESLDLMYMSTNDGVRVIDIGDTTSPTDDAFLYMYSTTSTPALPHNEAHSVYIDSENHYLYVSTANGLAIIDRNGTVTQSDDQVLITLNSFSDPSIGGINIRSCFINHTTDLLYINMAEGLSIIDTQGTASVADDLFVGTYDVVSTPALPGVSIWHSELDASGQYLFVAMYNTGLAVIDTNNTESIADDTLIKTYSTSSTPALFNNFVQHFQYDSATGLIYICSGSFDGGLSVFDLNSLGNAADDSIVATYNTISTIPLDYDTSNHVWYDSSSGYLYIFQFSSGTSGNRLCIIDTKKTLSTVDDEVHSRYGLESNPAIPSSSFNFYFDTSEKVLYVSHSDGYSVINIDSYMGDSFYISKPVSLTDNPSERIAWSQSLGTGQTVSVQTRTGSGSLFWTDDFNDNVAPTLQDPFAYGELFTTVEESAGTLKVSNPPVDEEAPFWLSLGQTFPAGSKILARIRTNSDADFYNSTITDDYEGWADNVTTNTWKVVQFVAPNDFEYVGFYPTWVAGTWQAGDTFEVDWVSVEAPDSSWGAWSTACTTSSGCALADNSGQDWIQYRVNMHTDDIATTPTISSVSLSHVSGYSATGTYTSSVIDARQNVKWTDLTASIVLPKGTFVTISTRTGDTATPDGTWSTWEEVNSPIASPEGRYLQYQMVFETTTPGSTPTLTEVGVTYDPDLVETGVGVLPFMLGGVGLIVPFRKKSR